METDLSIRLIIIGLLPIFFTLGWIAARVDIKLILNQAKSIPKKFYRALDALVDKKYNITLSLLSEIHEQQNENSANLNSFEVNLTLGKLYRIRGENDKAIILHKKLLKYPNLSTYNKQLLNFELGLDFKHAGLIDRAEQQLEQLIDTIDFDKQSKDTLLEIYQQDRNWDKAINLIKTRSDDELAYQLELAQFYCEIAQSYLFKSQFQESVKYSHTALNTNLKCTRANMILGNSYFKIKKYDQAITTYEKIEKQNYAYLSIIGEQLFLAYQKLNQEEQGLERIIGYLQTFPNLDLISLVYEKARIILGEEKAAQITSDLISKNPNIKNIYKLLNIKIMGVNPIWKTDAELMEKTLSRYINKATTYKCNHCYFKSQIFFWHCPSCNKWETFTPNKIDI